MSVDDERPAVIAATGLEANAARRALRDLPVRVVRVGVAFAGSHERSFSNVAISCGLAGGLAAEAISGSVVIATEVRRPGGETVRCDPALVEALCEGARSLGFSPIAAPLLTSATLVRGLDRARFGAQGFAAVDMETGLIEAPRIGAVRVVLDAQGREISEAWLRPLSAILRPSAWVELPWLARTAPRYARRAAEIVRAALPAIARLERNDDSTRLEGNS